MVVVFLVLVRDRFGVGVWVATVIMLVSEGSVRMVLSDTGSGSGWGGGGEPDVCRRESGGEACPKG